MLEKSTIITMMSTRNTNIIAVADMMRKDEVVKKIGMALRNPMIVKILLSLKNGINIGLNQSRKNYLPRKGQGHILRMKKLQINASTRRLIPPVRSYLRGTTIRNIGRKRIEENQHRAVAVAINQSRHLMQKSPTVTFQKMIPTEVGPRNSPSLMILSSIWITLCTFQCTIRLKLEDRALRTE